MKKIALVMALGFLVQMVPVGAQASSPSGPGGAVAVALLGFSLFGDSSSSAKAKTGNEFADLNNNPAVTNLLKQQAGGSSNTLEILK